MADANGCGHGEGADADEPPVPGWHRQLGPCPRQPHRDIPTVPVGWGCEWWGVVGARGRRGAVPCYGAMQWGCAVGLHYGAVLCYEAEL